MKLIRHLKEMIDSQYGNPIGLLGMYIGEKMVKQHVPETLWTIKLLELQQDEKILELGCGAGYAIKLLLKQPSVKQVVGIDASKSVLQSATIRNKKEIKDGKVKFVQSNVSNLVYKDGGFTKVFSIHSIYFWDNLFKSISEIYRVLKPDGTVVLTLCDGKAGQTSKDTTDMMEQVIAFMGQSGFQNIEILRGPNSREYHTVSIRAKK